MRPWKDTDTSPCGLSHHKTQHSLVSQGEADGAALAFPGGTRVARAEHKRDSCPKMLLKKRGPSSPHALGLALVPQGSFGNMACQQIQSWTCSSAAVSREPLAHPLLCAGLRSDGGGLSGIAWALRGAKSHSRALQSGSETGRARPGLHQRMMTRSWKAPRACCILQAKREGERELARCWMKMCPCVNRQEEAIQPGLDKLQSHSCLERAWSGNLSSLTYHELQGSWRLTRRSSAPSCASLVTCKDLMPGHGAGVGNTLVAVQELVCTRTRSRGLQGVVT